MDLSVVVLAFVLLLVGSLYLNRIWLGALGGVLLLITYHIAIDENSVAPALLNGTLISFELLLLVIGAFLFYNTLKSQQHFQPLIQHFGNSTAKLEVLLFFSIFFGGFLEGVAGFGIPAMLIAPILLNLGYSALTSITIPLIANSTSVLFGALGAPLVIGMQQTEIGDMIPLLLMLNALPILMLPFVIAFSFSLTEKCKVSFKKVWKNLLFVGVLFLIPFSITAPFSIELPSVVAGLTGMILFPAIMFPINIKPKSIFWIKFLSPYLAFIIMLIIARFTLIEQEISLFADIKKISFYQPGLIFILSAMFYSIYRKKSLMDFGIVLKSTLVKLQKTAFTILLLVLFAQLIQNELSQSVGTLVNTQGSIFAIPILGSLGSFTLGSATISNLIFSGGIIEATAINQNNLFLALLHSGSCIGNVISLQNILMVNSIMPESTPIKNVFKVNIRWFAIYFPLVWLAVLLWLLF